MRSLDPRLPVLVGLGAAADAAPVVDLMTDAVSAAAADAGAPGAARPHRLHRRAPGHVVAHRPGAHRRPARRLARRAHAPLRDRRLPTGGDQPRAGAGGDPAAPAPSSSPDPRRGPGPVTAASRPTKRTARPTRSSPGRPTSWPRWRSPPASSGRPCSSTRSLRTPSPRRCTSRRSASARRSPRSGPGSTQWRSTTPRRRSPNDATRRTSPRRGRTTARLSFPYNRWHSSQWTVDQASALLICSAERAREAGVPPERWLFPHVALHSSEAVTLTARRRLEEWPAMEVLGRAAATHLGRPAARAPPRRGLLLLSRRGTGAATRPRARPRRHPDAHRRHGLRRRAVQPLRPAIARACWADGCGPSRPSRAC